MRTHHLVTLILAIPISAMAQHGDPSPGGTKPERRVNRLAEEQSPYLLQHRFNPVDWYPWGEEAFARAKKEGKPVFLSIGYSACHWCHVMERESFENAEIAALLNRFFVSIKVDREERPDVDRVYMDCCILRTGRGGWPLTVFMTPERKPFFAGTYFQPERFRSMVSGIGEAWQKDREEIEASADEITRRLQGLHSGRSGGELAPALLGRSLTAIESREDTARGGFGHRQKFPMPCTLLFLLRAGARAGDERAWGPVRRQLDAMMRGGIRDHLAGGYHRYSTDPTWLVPHFEKMLYDQALLARVYLEAAQATGETRYAEVAREILDFCLGTLRTEDGGFIAALDADTEGIEGLTYTWKLNELAKLLSADELKVLCAWSACTPEGNWEEGRNILHAARSVPEVAAQLEMKEAAVTVSLSRVREKLLAARLQKPQPRRDDKVLIGWNALMIQALARTAGALDEPRYLAAALEAAALISRQLRTEEGQLLRSWAKGVAKHPADLFDHAALLGAWLDLHAATLDDAWLARAKELAGVMRARFRGSEGQWVDSVAPDLVVTTSDLFDGALPSGTSLACVTMARLGHVTGERQWLEDARKALEAGAAEYEQRPSASPLALVALDLLLHPVARVSLTGPLRDGSGAALLAGLRRSYQPFVVLAREGSDATSFQAVVCVGTTCLEPVTTLPALLERLKQALAR